MATFYLTKEVCEKCMALGDSSVFWWCGNCKQWFCDRCRLRHPHLGNDDTTDMNLLECYRRVGVWEEMRDGKTDNLTRVGDGDDE
jgi:hypothetical protein